MIEPTRAQMKAATDASRKLTEHGDRATGQKPVSPTADLEAHARVMLIAAFNVRVPPRTNYYTINPPPGPEIAA